MSATHVGSAGASPHPTPKQSVTLPHSLPKKDQENSAPRLWPTWHAGLALSGLAVLQSRNGVQQQCPSMIVDAVAGPPSVDNAPPTINAATKTRTLRDRICPSNAKAPRDP
jgi:hypothetical protein